MCALVSLRNGTVETYVSVFKGVSSRTIWRLPQQCVECSRLLVHACFVCRLIVSVMDAPPWVLTLYCVVLLTVFLGARWSLICLLYRTVYPDSLPRICVSLHWIVRFK